MFGEHFQFIIFVIVQSGTDHGKEQIALLLFFDQFLQTIVLGNAKVQIAVRDQDHLVVAVFLVVFRADLVGGLDAGRAVGAAVDHDRKQTPHQVFLISLTLDLKTGIDRLVPVTVGDQTEGVALL